MSNVPRSSSNLPFSGVFCVIASGVGRSDCWRASRAVICALRGVETLECHDVWVRFRHGTAPHELTVTVAVCHSVCVSAVSMCGDPAGTAKPRRRGKGKRHKGGDDETIGWRVRTTVTRLPFPSTWPQSPPYLATGLRRWLVSRSSSVTINPISLQVVPVWWRALGSQCVEMRMDVVQGRWPLTDPLEMTSCINCGTAMAVIGLVSHWAGCKNRKRGRKVSVGGPVTSGTLQFVGLDKPLGSGKKVANGAADNPKRLLSPANGMEASAASSSQVCRVDLVRRIGFPLPGFPLSCSARLGGTRRPSQ